MRCAVAAAATVGRQFMKAALAASMVPAVAVITAGARGAQASAAGQVASPARAAAILPGRHRPVQAFLSEVSCKGPAFCLAVGLYSRPGHPKVPFVQEWNGRTWRIVADPLRGGIYDLTCGSRSFCLGTRFVLIDPFDGTPYQAVWNGRTWRSFKNPPAELGDASCSSPTFCANLGANLQTVQAWNGKSWQDMPTSQCGQGLECSCGGVSCASATNCVGDGTVCGDENCYSQGPFEAGSLHCLITDRYFGAVSRRNARAGSRAVWRSAAAMLVCRPGAGC